MSERMSAAEFYEEAEQGDYVELSWAHEKLTPARGIVQGMLRHGDEVIVVLNRDGARFRLPATATGRIIQRNTRRDGFGIRRR